MSDEVILNYDAEPEDAWDRGDPIGVLLDNLSRRCAELGEPQILIDGTLMELLEDVRRRVGRIRKRMLSDRDSYRVDLINEDIEFLFGRLEEEGLGGS